MLLQSPVAGGSISENINWSFAFLPTSHEVSSTAGDVVR